MVLTGGKNSSLVTLAGMNTRSQLILRLALTIISTQQPAAEILKMLSSLQFNQDLPGACQERSAHLLATGCSPCGPHT